MLNKLALCLAVLLSALPAGAAAADEAPRDLIFQASTIGALMEGGYEGWMTAGELKTHGDIGIGTFDALDGEMVMLNGAVYQVRSDGSVARVKDTVTLPFAEVTVFDADRTATLSGITGREQLEQALDTAFPAKNVPCAVKLRGKFSYVKTRSVPAQKKPYPRLAEVTRTQPVFERRNVPGTIVGFRFPAWFGGVAVPGYHFHFISDDKKTGGHLLDASAERLNAVVDDTHEFHLTLPKGQPFGELDIPGAGMPDTSSVEKQ